MTTDALPWLQPLSLAHWESYGELVIEQHWDEPPGLDRWITIRQADPRILVARELLRELAAGTFMKLMLPEAAVFTTCACSPGIACDHFQGAKLEVCGRDRKVIYVIGKLDPRFDAFAAEWPD